VLEHPTLRPFFGALSRISLLLVPSLSRLCVHAERICSTGDDTRTVSSSGGLRLVQASGLVLKPDLPGTPCYISWHRCVSWCESGGRDLTIFLRFSQRQARLAVPSAEGGEDVRLPLRRQPRRGPNHPRTRCSAQPTQCTHSVHKKVYTHWTHSVHTVYTLTILQIFGRF
jgi:hypothetical protein